MENETPNKIFYNKLIRDFIQAKIEAKGEHCEVRVITDANEFQQELLKKVREEASSLAHTQTREDFLREYSDLMMALDALTGLMEFSKADIAAALAENIETKGLYKNRHFLHWSDDSGYKSNETPQGIK